MIKELEQKASKETAVSEVLEKLGNFVKERDGINKKLSTTYSLGRDGQKQRSKSLRPLYDGKPRSYSFQGSKKENVTIFHTLSDITSSSEEYGSLMEEADDDLSEEEEVIGNANAKGKVTVEEESDDEIHGDEYVATSSSRFTRPCESVVLEAFSL